MPNDMNLNNMKSKAKVVQVGICTFPQCGGKKTIVFIVMYLKELRFYLTSLNTANKNQQLVQSKLLWMICMKLRLRVKIL
jgi:hypothetical protein